MSKLKKDLSLIHCSHDRQADYKKTVDKLFNLVNNFADQNELKSLNCYFEKTYKF